MVETIPFGKYRGRSVEQVVLTDYLYFDYFYNKIAPNLWNDSLKKRVNYVEEVVNDFVSKTNCVNCDEFPAEKISIYNGYDNTRLSDPSFLYCSLDCYNLDSNVSPKSILHPLEFRSAISSTKTDTNSLVNLMSDCMGLKKTRRTKDYLEDFFNNVDLKKNSDNLISKRNKNQLSFWD